MISLQSAFWTVETLEPFLLAIEKRFMTGPIIRVKTGPAEETEFDTRKVDIEQVQLAILRKLYELDPDNYENPDTQKRMKVYTVYN